MEVLKDKRRNKYVESADEVGKTRVQFSAAPPKKVVSKDATFFIQADKGGLVCNQRFSVVCNCNLLRM